MVIDNRNINHANISNNQKSNLLTAIAASALHATIIICNAIVVSNASDKIFDKAEDIPHRKVELVLGTAPVTPWGTHNLYGYGNGIVG